LITLLKRHASNRVLQLPTKKEITAWIEFTAIT